MLNSVLLGMCPLKNGYISSYLLNATIAHASLAFAKRTQGKGFFMTKPKSKKPSVAADDDDWYPTDEEFK